GGACGRSSCGDTARRRADRSGRGCEFASRNPIAGRAYRGEGEGASSMARPVPPDARRAADVNRADAQWPDPVSAALPIRRRNLCYSACMERTFAVLGALSAGLAVVAVAFAAHGLRSRITPQLLAGFETGARPQAFHPVLLPA